MEGFLDKVNPQQRRLGGQELWVLVWASGACSMFRGLRPRLIKSGLNIKHYQKAEPDVSPTL